MIGFCNGIKRRFAQNDEDFVLLCLRFVYINYCHCEGFARGSPAYVFQSCPPRHKRAYGRKLIVSVPLSKNNSQDCFSRQSALCSVCAGLPRPHFVRPRNDDKCVGNRYFGDKSLWGRLKSAFLE